MREFVILERLVQALIEFKKSQNEQKLKLGSKYDKTFDFVFTLTGKLLPKSTFTNALDRILKKVNLHQISIHGLRHSHAVIMKEAGVEMKYIQERLGHKSIEITADIYSHITPKFIENEQSKFDTYVGQEFTLEKSGENINVHLGYVKPKPKRKTLNTICVKGFQLLVKSHILVQWL